VAKIRGAKCPRIVPQWIQEQQHADPQGRLSRLESTSLSVRVGVRTDLIRGIITAFRYGKTPRDNATSHVVAQVNVPRVGEKHIIPSNPQSGSVELPEAPWDVDRCKLYKGPVGTMQRDLQDNDSSNWSTNVNVSQASGVTHRVRCAQGLVDTTAIRNVLSPTMNTSRAIVSL
jgi:hypothetical protein